MNRARSKTAQEILNNIVAHINKSPFSAGNWYVGITQNIQQRLFGAHNVSEENGWWIFDMALSTFDARNVEEALIKWGCDGGTGGGDSDALYVYAYYKAANTRR